MSTRFGLVVLFGLLVPFTVFAQTQTQSLADIAKAEEERRNAIAQPSKVYTNTDLRPFEREGPRLGDGVSSCQSEEKHDWQSGNSYVIQTCPDGTTTEHGSNRRTGATWQNKYFPDGSSEGIDPCGNRWTYDAATTVYVNENGERRAGLGEFRKRLASPAPCKEKSPTKLEVLLERIAAERSALSRAQIFADALQSRINALSAWPCPPESARPDGPRWAGRVQPCYVIEEDPAQRAVVEIDRQKALAELDRVKEEIQQHQKAIAAIQEEARRAGVPPGWLR